MQTAHLATIPSRETTLRLVLESIVPFVDHTFVALSGYNYVPTWLDDFKTVTSRIFSNEKGDANKFAFINEVSGLVLVTDDDLIWNPNAIAILQKKVGQYNCPCSYHGKAYTLPFRGFKHFSGNYRCLGNTVGDHPVQIIGTGTLMFNTNMVKLSADSFPYPNMADVLFSREAILQGVNLMAVEHRAGVVGYLNPKETIWGNTKSYALHDKIIKTFLK